MSDYQTENQGQMLARLREPFPPESINKLPKGNEDKSKRRKCNTCDGYHDPSMFHLDYVGHAALTDRLLNVDPLWTWEPFATDGQGAPLVERTEDGQPVGLWIRLTVAGMTRPGYGSCAPGKSDAVKELIGDALRNAAMRFGCALDLWHKGELPSHDDEPAPEPAPETVDLAELEGAILTAQDLGLEGDWDKTRRYAQQSQGHAEMAVAKLSERMDGEAS